MIVNNAPPLSLFAQTNFALEADDEIHAITVVLSFWRRENFVNAKLELLDGERAVNFRKLLLELLVVRNVAPAARTAAIGVWAK